MKTKPVTLLLSCLLLPIAVAGCLPGLEDLPGGGEEEEPDEPDPPDATARQLFDKNVYPILNDKCSGGGCHGESAPAGNPNFLAAVATQAYDRAIKQPKLVGDFTVASPILTKIAPGHKGRTYTTGEVEKITKWLTKEVAEKGPQRDLMREWSGCMTLEDLQASNLANATGNAYADDGGQCKTCHNLGEYDFVASPVVETMFQKITTDRTWLGQYFAVDSTNTKVEVNEPNFQEVGNALPPLHNTHPEFDPYLGPGMLALRDFHTRTLVRFNAKTCGAPKF
jgi:hypothetical protein